MRIDFGQIIPLELFFTDLVKTSTLFKQINLNDSSDRIVYNIL